MTRYVSLKSKYVNMICVYLKIKCTEEIKLIDVLSVALHVILCVFCVAKIKQNNLIKKLG